MASSFRDMSQSDKMDLFEKFMLKKAESKARAKERKKLGVKGTPGSPKKFQMGDLAVVVPIEENTRGTYKNWIGKTVEVDDYRRYSQESFYHVRDPKTGKSRWITSGILYPADKIGDEWEDVLYVTQGRFGTTIRVPTNLIEKIETPRVRGDEILRGPDRFSREKVYSKADDVTRSSLRYQTSSKFVNRLDALSAKWFGSSAYYDGSWEPGEPISRARQVVEDNLDRSVLSAKEIEDSIEGELTRDFPKTQDKITKKKLRESAFLKLNKFRLGIGSDTHPGPHNWDTGLGDLWREADTRSSKVLNSGLDQGKRASEIKKDIEDAYDELLPNSPDEVTKRKLRRDYPERVAKSFGDPSWSASNFINLLAGDKLREEIPTPVPRVRALVPYTKEESG